MRDVAIAAIEKLHKIKQQPAYEESSFSTYKEVKPVEKAFE